MDLLSRIFARTPSLRTRVDVGGRRSHRTKDALTSARDFAAVSSHDLRTPLTAMRTNLEVLRHP